MAKRKRVTIAENPFAKTERAARTDRAATAASDARAPTRASAQSRTPQEEGREVTDRVRAISVSLRESEYAQFDRIAAELKPFPVRRMAVMNFALRWFLQQHKAGKIDLGTSIDELTARIVISSTKRQRG